MSLTLVIERTLDNRNEAQRIAWLEAQNACLRERVRELELELRAAQPVEGISIVRMGAYPVGQA